MHQAFPQPGVQEDLLGEQQEGSQGASKKGSIELGAEVFRSSDLKMLEDISLFMSGAISVFCLPCNVVTARGCCGYSGHPSEHHLCLVPPYAALHALEQQHGGTGTRKHQQC